MLSVVSAAAKMHKLFPLDSFNDLRHCGTFVNFVSGSPLGQDWAMFEVCLFFWFCFLFFCFFKRNGLSRKEAVSTSHCIPSSLVKWYDLLYELL